MRAAQLRLRSLFGRLRLHALGVVIVTILVIESGNTRRGRVFILDEQLNGFEYYRTARFVSCR